MQLGADSRLRYALGPHLTVATPMPGATPGVNVRATPRATPGPSSLPFAPPSVAVDGGVLSGGPTDVLARSGVDPSISLGEFQATYTSEDNASFEALVDKLNGERQKRYHWMYDKDNMQVVLAGPALPELAMTAAGAAGTSTDMVATTGESVNRETPAGEPRPLEYWNHRVRNALMFYPEGLESTAAERVQQASARPTVNYAAVRFSRNPFATAAATPRGTCRLTQWL